MGELRKVGSRQSGTEPAESVDSLVPSVSLFIPVRNGERYLSQCIESILKQSFTGWRLNIQDNRSTDGTARIVEAFLGDERISYSLNERDLGSVGNYNRCLERVDSEFYGIFSHDDFLCHSGALAAALQAMETHKDVGVVYSDVEWVDAKARRIAVKRMPYRGRIAGNEVSRVSLIDGRNHFGVPVLVRADAVRGLRYDPAFPLTADVDFSIACASRAYAYFLPFEAIAIRFHSSNGTMRAFVNTRREFEILPRKHGIALSRLELLRFRIALPINTWKKRLFFLYLDHLRGDAGRRVLAFLVVGGFNTLLGVSSYGLLLRLGFPFPAASALSLALGIVVGFHAHGRLVFRRPGGFLRYLIIWLGVYILANGLIWTMRPFLGTFWAGVAATPVNALAAFWALRRWVFREILTE
jgi:glycosyltransferase involved in cell wall biosynthesis